MRSGDSSSRPAAGKVETLTQRLLPRYLWLLAFVACAVVSYLVIWQRGLLTDDYSFHAQVVNAVTGARRLYIPREANRVLAFFVDVNLAGLLPAYEWPVRLLAALITAANALLLGALVYRLTRQRLLLVVTARLFLAPVYAHQAVPQRNLPDNTVLTRIELDERLFGGYDGLSQMLSGVFQTSWSACDALRGLYRRADVAAVGVTGWTLHPVHYEGWGSDGVERIVVAGVRVPVDRAVPFAYRDGRVTIIESLSISQGGQRHHVVFPRAQQAASGATSIISEFPASAKGRSLAGLEKEF